jgi:hypothetical protein
MGLGAPIEFHGLGSKNGYYRLAGVNWAIEEPTTVRLKLHGYASKAAFDEGKPPLFSQDRSVDVVDDRGNPDMAKVEILVRVRELSYLEIKRFPEFSEAIDL